MPKVSSLIPGCPSSSPELHVQKIVSARCGARTIMPSDVWRSSATWWLPQSYSEYDLHSHQSALPRLAAGSVVLVLELNDSKWSVASVRCMSALLLKLKHVWPLAPLPAWQKPCHPGNYSKVRCSAFAATGCLLMYCWPDLFVDKGASQSNC